MVFLYLFKLIYDCIKLSVLMFRTDYFREQVLSMQEDTKSNIAEFLTLLPAGLELEDVPDFCSLAQYYAAKTPSSFREVM